MRLMVKNYTMNNGCLARLPKLIFSAAFGSGPQMLYYLRNQIF